MTEFSIAQLWVYPVKSLGGMAVEVAKITSAGSFRFDREWVVITPEGNMLWQGDLPRMTLLSAAIEKANLRMTDRDGSSIVLSNTRSAPNLIVRQYGFEIPGVDAGDEAASWLSDRLGRECRLAHIGPAAHEWGGLNPLHIISLNSLVVLNTHLAEEGGTDVEVERFRPNVVLGGTHDAYSEEYAQEVHFSSATLALREPCVRCILPNISRVDAKRGKQPLKLIGVPSRQRASAKPASFGTYSSALGAHLSVGDISQRSGLPLAR